MNSLIALSCLLAVAVANPSGYGLGGIIHGAAPIPVIRTAAVSPIIAPAVTTVPVLRTVGIGYGGLGRSGYGWGGLGWGGLGYGRLGYGGLGYGGAGYGGLGYGGYGYGGYGYGGHGLRGLGYGGWGGRLHG